MNRVRITWLVGLLMFLTSTHAQQPQWKTPIWLGVEPSGSALTLRVISTGCTKKEDFRFTANADAQVEITRIRPDNCRAKPRMVEFCYSFAELRISKTAYFQIADTELAPNN